MIDPKLAIKEKGKKATVKKTVVNKSLEVKTTQRPKKPLCIIGTADTSKDAPYDLMLAGETEYMYDIWGINTALVKEDVKRLDVCFEMHPKRYWGLLPVMQRLNDFGGKVVMQDHHDEIPKSVAYPYESVKKKYHLDAMGENLYVTNTITWMILMALEEGYTDISLYGIHMSHATEYAYQRASCSWILGVIHGWILDGKPYKLTIPKESQLLKAEYEYGFDEPTELMNYLASRIEGMNKGISEADAQINSLQVRKERTIGAVSEVKNLRDKVYGYQ